MKAITCYKYGPLDVLQLREVEKPAPRHNEVLIRVHATTVTTREYGFAAQLILPGSGFLGL
jgi:NADPH:quinone reductase-like Zn-dependent oxidoreductase